MNKIKLLAISLSLVTSLSAQVRNADFKIHDRGELWETMKDNGTIGAPNPTNRFENYPSMDWPGGPNVMNKDDQRSYSAGSGMWIGGKRNDGSIFFTENGPFNFVDNGTFETIVKADNFLGSPSYNPAEAEQIITAKWKTSENISVERNSRAWSFPLLNNFIICEYVITNQNSAPVTDVYIGFPNLIRPSYQDFVVHNGWGDDFNRTDEFVAYDSTRNMLYSWDDTPNFSIPNDIGNFWEAAGELRTTGYSGFSFLYADPASDNRPQPSNVFWAQLLNNESFLTIQSSSAQSLYNILNGTDKSLQANAGDHLTPFMLMSAGPYSLAPGAAIKIVVAEAVNGIPLEKALLGLSSQSLLHFGSDSLSSSVDRAKILYQNNYQVAAVPPPSPEIDIYSLPSNQTIAVTWSPIEDFWSNPLSGKSDFKEYKVYRSDRSYIGPFTMIRRIDPKRSTDRTRFYDSENNKWVFEDQTISLGAGYFYAVTSSDSAGKESWLTNRNETAITATRNPADNTLNVKVFPNPFKEVSGFPTSGTENFIVFSNLPAVCTIRIYTTSGELVRTLDHDNPNSGEEVWDQLTDARQRTSPGIYFYTVDSSVGTAQGTLIIIK
ncbi:MAG: T9SS type A sorting domain-containing protein [Ignavibacteriaceae bacterium]